METMKKKGTIKPRYELRLKVDNGDTAQELRRETSVEDFADNGDLAQELWQETSVEVFAQKVWGVVKNSLKELARTTFEPGCSVILKNMPGGTIDEIEELAKSEAFAFAYWYPNQPGHPGEPLGDIGLIAWNIDEFLSKYPFKVSTFILLVELTEEGKIVSSIIDINKK